MEIMYKIGIQNLKEVINQFTICLVSQNGKIMNTYTDIGHLQWPPSRKVCLDYQINLYNPLSYE